MYYEEQIIDGILHYRVVPFGDFMPMTPEMLTNKIEEIKKQFLPLAKDCEHHQHDHCTCSDGFCHYGR